MEFFDFDLLVEPSGDGTYRARVVRGPGGETSVIFALPLSDLEIENFLLKIGRPRRSSVRGIASAEAAEIRQFGERLFQAVFRDEVGVAFRRSLDQVEDQDAGLRLRLHLSECPELGDLPWEYLYDPSTRRFLALSEWTPVVRYLDLPERVRPLAVNPPLRVLVLVSAPTDYPTLDVAGEVAKLEDGLRALVLDRRVEIRRVPDGSLLALQKELRRGQYHVFHYIGHGGYDAHADDGVLIMEGPEGRGQEIGGQELGSILHNHRTLRLAVLNSCEGARAGRHDPYSGTAQSLVQQGIPAVVAMQFEITDDAALVICGVLYEAIADGYPLDAAVAESRKAVRSQPNAVEWGTPVLYMRAPDGRIFDVATDRHLDAVKPVTDDPRLLSAVAALFSERLDEAVDTLTALQIDYPKDPLIQIRLDEALLRRRLNTLYRQGVGSSESGDWDAAVSSFEQVISADGSYHDVAERLKSARREQQRSHLMEELRQLYAAQRWHAIIALEKEFAALDPPMDDPDGLVSQARNALREGRARRSLGSALRRWFRALARRPALVTLISAIALVSLVLGLLKLNGARTRTFVEFAADRTIPTADAPLDIQVDVDSLLVSFRSGLLERIDSATGVVRKRVDFASPTGGGPLVGSDDIVLPLTKAGSLGFVNSNFESKNTLTIPGGYPQNGIVVPDGFWFACPTDTSGFLVHISERKEVGNRLPLPFKPFELLASDNFLFVTFADNDLVGKFDLTTGNMTRGNVPSYPLDVAMVDGDLWITLANSNEVAIVDPNTLTVKSRHPVGDRPWKIAVGPESVWVTNRSTSVPNVNGTVSRLDPKTGLRQQEDIGVGAKPDTLAVGVGEVYVVNEKNISVLRGS
jgi:YVTN family beta-propeller protein